MGAPAEPYRPDPAVERSQGRATTERDAAPVVEHRTHVDVRRRAPFAGGCGQGPVIGQHAASQRQVPYDRDRAGLGQGHVEAHAQVVRDQEGLGQAQADVLTTRPGPHRAGARPDALAHQRLVSGDQYLAEWSLWSTTVRVAVRRPDDLSGACRAVQASLAEMDAVANRFAPSSEVSQLAVTGATESPVSPLLAFTVREALRVARATDGAVDPTLGQAMVALGYDGAEGPADSPLPGVRLSATTSWRDVRLVGDRLTVPAGVLLDLGATGKALAVDRAAEAAWVATNGPVLVGVGGDLRALGEEPGQGWLVEVAERPEDPGSAWVEITAGGLATSSTLVRTWRRDGDPLHHVLDPVTWQPAAVHWRTVTAAAATCVDANAATTAALVKGAAAVPWLRAQRLPARLVHRDGSVLAVGGWPQRDAA